MSDPSEILCRVYDSFDLSYQSTLKNMNAKDILPRPYLSNNSCEIKSDIRTENTDHIPIDETIVDRESYESLLELKRKVDKPPEGMKQDTWDRIYREALQIVYPFENVPNSIFMDRAGLKIANTDAIYNVTRGIKPGLIKMRSDLKLSYCSIAEGPGAFVQYIQFRYPNSVGFGMTLKTDDSKLDWNLNLIDQSKFIPVYGEDGTGNLYKNWSYLEKEIRRTYPEGVLLVTADGGFEVKSTPPEKRETESGRLLLTQFLTGISVVQTGGNFVCKLFETLTPISKQLIWILSCCFKRISFFKPISSRTTNTERYIVCEDANPNRYQYISLLSNANDSYNSLAMEDKTKESMEDKTDDPSLLNSITNQYNVVNLFSNNLPDDFILWLKEQNQLSIDRQYKILENIDKVMLAMANNDPIPIVNQYEYDINKLLIIWNLPDRPIVIRAERYNMEQRSIQMTGRGPKPSDVI